MTACVPTMTAQASRDGERTRNARLYVAAWISAAAHDLVLFCAIQSLWKT